MRTGRESIEDQLLVMAAQGGDADSLGELARRWHHRHWLHARNLLGNADDARDVCQDAWLSICRGIRRLTDPAAFPAWAYRIVTNKAADFIRRRQSQRNRDAAVASEMESSANANPDANDATERIQQGMLALAADERALLSLFYLDDLSTAEVAEVLGIPRGTVKSRMHQARNRLRQILERTM